MENEVMEVAVNEGMDTCSTVVNFCSIGKALLITAAIGSAVVIGARMIKKMRAKKAIKIEMLSAAEEQTKS